jgi:hypothetical protein
MMRRSGEILSLFYKPSSRVTFRQQSDVQIVAMLLEHMHKVFAVNQRNWVILGEFMTIPPVMARGYEVRGSELYS